MKLWNYFSVRLRKLVIGRTVRQYFDVKQVFPTDFIIAPCVSLCHDWWVIWTLNCVIVLLSEIANKFVLIRCIPLFLADSNRSG